MQQLMEQNPLPMLLMRTVIQSLTMYPRLGGFVMNILSRLIMKQVGTKLWLFSVPVVIDIPESSFCLLLVPVDHNISTQYEARETQMLITVVTVCAGYCLLQVWKYPKVWEGFVKCCQRTKPQSYSVLLQLPPAQLTSVFERCPEMREPLLQHVHSFTPHQVTAVFSWTSFTVHISIYLHHCESTIPDVH